MTQSQINFFSNYETLCSYPNWSTLLKDQPRIIYEVLEESIIMENKQLSDEYVMGKFSQFTIFSAKFKYLNFFLNLFSYK